MSGKKTTMAKLLEEFEILKDKHKKEISDLKETVEKQETRIEMLEKLANDKKVKDHGGAVNLDTKNHAKRKMVQLNCNKCDIKFSKFCDLELHIKKNHGNYEEQECDQCDKKFVTAWRLRKHRRIHFQKFTKICNYFKMKRSCPFEELGCKFIHDVHKLDKVVQKDVDISVETDDSISMESFETEDDTSSFHASTPKSDYNCEECQNKSKCVDCFVKHTLGHGNGKERKLFF